MKVTGYRMPFYKEMAERYDLKPEDMIGATCQLCFSRIVSDTKLKDEPSEDALDRIVNTNIGRCTEFDYERNECIIIFDSEMPLGVFKSYYNDEPILRQEVEDHPAMYWLTVMNERQSRNNFDVSDVPKDVMSILRMAKFAYKGIITSQGDMWINFKNKQTK